MRPSRNVQLIQLAATAVLACVALGTSALLAQDAIPQPLAAKGKLQYSDDFEREKLAPWKQIIRGVRVENGVLITSREKDHGAVARIETLMQDAIVNFRFNFADSPAFNACFNDRSYKGSHVGHICRVSFTKNSIRLVDGKEGLFRNDIFEMGKDPSQAAARDKLLEGRTKTFEYKFDAKKWYSATIEIVADQMRVSVDGKPVGFLKSSGIGHPRKENFSFTGPGKEMHYDDVKIWTTAATENQPEASASSAQALLSDFAEHWDASKWEKPSRGGTYMRATADEGWKVRMTTLRSLILQGEKAVPALTEALDSDDEPTRILAAQALSYLGPHADIKRLETVIKSDKSAAVRLYAVDAIAMSGKSDQVDWKPIGQSERGRDVRKHIGYANQRGNNAISNDVIDTLKNWDPALMDSAQVGSPAPEFTLKTVEGKTVALSDYRGKQPVVLVFIYGDT